MAKRQSECFAAGVLFARTEGILPAPEPTHALAAAIEEAHRCTETGEEKVILTALCGHGHLDLTAYDAYLSGTITDHSWDDEELQSAVNERSTSCRAQRSEAVGAWGRLPRVEQAAAVSDLAALRWSLRSALRGVSTATGATGGIRLTTATSAASPTTDIAMSAGATAVEDATRPASTIARP